MKRIALMFAIALTLRGVALAQTSEFAWDCDLLKSKPATLSAGASVRRAEKRVTPELPGDANIRDARVTVALAVDASGSVQCVHVKQGNPPLTGSSVQAAKDWKFKPYAPKGRPVPFVADLTFHFIIGRVLFE